MNSHRPQVKIPATYMRGGTSKGVFFKLNDLPAAAQVPGETRDRLLMRVMGSPDPYGKQTDGMGAATSSTSKAVILAPSARPDHDVDYLFGQVSIDGPMIDWTGNCGNLSGAVGPFAIANGLVDPARVPGNGMASIRIWQANIGKTIIARVPVTDGLPQETGDFELDGVTFPAAEVQLDFMDPADEGEGALFPTGKLVDDLAVPGLAHVELSRAVPDGQGNGLKVPMRSDAGRSAAGTDGQDGDSTDGLPSSGTLKATLINAGIPTIFVNAADVGCTGRELQGDINNDAATLAMFEAIRAAGALAMGLIGDVSEAASRQHTPKVAFVAPPDDFVASSGKAVAAGDINLLVRALSMGKLHHAMMGTASVAIATAAAIPGTLVNLAAGGGELGEVRFGHPSGTLRVGAEAVQQGDTWLVKQVTMSRSARVLMEGWVRVPVEQLANP